MINDYKRLFALMGKRKLKYIFTILIANLIHTPRYTIQAHLFGLIINYFVYRVGYTDTTAGNAALREIIIIFSIFFVQSAVLTPVTMHLGARVRELIVMDMKVGIFKKIKSYPVGYFEKFHSGDILARINRDTDSLAYALHVVDNFNFHFMSIFIVLPYFLFLDYRLGLVLLVCSILSAYINLKFVQPIRVQNKDRNVKLADMSKVLSENVTGFNIIKMFNLRKYFNTKLEDTMDKIYNVENEFVKTESRMYSISGFIYEFSRILFIFTAVYLVIKGELLAGFLVSTIMVGKNLSFHFLRVGQNVAYIQKAFAGIDRLYELFDQEKEPERYDTDSSDIVSGISIKNGKFGYTEDQPVLEGLNIKVPKGKKAALVGDSGGGKSTIVKLLLGFYELSEGEMTINQKPVGDYSLEELRKQTAYVPQDAYIFNGTIFDNIRFGNHEASYEEIIEASKKANAHDFIMEQKDSYNTIVGERGIRLSGGQKQRVSIARAILKNAPVLLLDEATSSLDSESEYLVQQALEELMKGKTGLIVAHRLSTIKKADIIYFISDGRVVEEGTHDELLLKNGQYAGLYYRKFADNAAVI
jgi:ATP-binding cassette subfamily B protein